MGKPIKPEGFMKNDVMKVKTKKFAVDTVKFVSALPYNRINKVLGDQFLRSGTSTGANYRAVCQARSKPDFISKMGIVLEEADESLFWIELFEETTAVSNALTEKLKEQADEIVAMAFASLKTAKSS